MASLRQRIRSEKISCRPWDKLKHEIELLCVSGKACFSKNGIPYDVMEMQLISEGWIREDESILDVLSSENRLRMSMFGREKYDSSLGDFPSDWTEEDFKFYEEEKPVYPFTMKLYDIRQDPLTVSD